MFLALPDFSGARAKTGIVACPLLVESINPWMNSVCVCVCAAFLSSGFSVCPEV